MRVAARDSQKAAAQVISSVRLITVTTGTDLTDRTGSVLATIYGLKDELFLADLRDKTRRGMEGAIRRGRSAGGRAYGYRSEPVTEDGQVVGPRRVIDSDEAAVVVRIFELYRDGRSPQAIAHLLNEEHVTPPRPVRGRRLMGWTWSTILDSPRRALGILNNPLYDGRLVWNRSRKVLDPNTGRRVMRPRPKSEWLSVDVPDLRIVPADLWRAAQDRRTRRRSPLRGNTRGRYTSALLSGLLVCDPCGSHYVLAKPTYYGCTAHHDRGPAICTNGRLRAATSSRRALSNSCSIGSLQSIWSTTSSNTRTKRSDACGAAGRSPASGRAGSRAGPPWARQCAGRDPGRIGDAGHEEPAGGP